MKKRSATIAAAAASLAALSLTGAPPASATTTNYTVNCTSANAQSFEVSAGDIIVFAFTAPDCATMFTNAGITVVTFQTIVNGVANLTGTGGTAVADFATKTVTYTAGSGSGTDSLTMPTLTMSRLSGRALNARAAQFTMSTLREAGPASWIQQYARPASSTSCLPTYSGSWAQWPNGGSGGFVCTREQYYQRSSASWQYRSSR